MQTRLYTYILYEKKKRNQAGDVRSTLTEANVTRKQGICAYNRVRWISLYREFKITCHVSKRLLTLRARLFALVSYDPYRAVIAD